MPLDIFLALVAFSAVMAFTPGPNNIMLAASGVNFGFAPTIPHMAGVTIGFAVLLIVGGTGLGLLFATAPSLQLVLKIAGALYMLWLAFRVATAHAKGEEGGTPARPFTFLQAAAFQWINPKAVIAAVSAVAIYVRPGHETGDFVVMLTVLTVATALSVSTWAGFGVALRGLLANPRHARIFNVSMGALLVASIVPMVV
jgi:threonine/homoserine/homoserine lactone efflux protein